MLRTVPLAGSIAFIIGLYAVSARALQTEPSSVKDGAYSEAQGVRGEEAYRTDCASCHAPDLKGSGQAPPLIGAEFVENWKGPAFDLFDRIHATMPADRPGQLPLDRTADIMAFMLKANGFPAGPRDLGSEPEALKKIRIEAAP